MIIRPYRIGAARPALLSNIRLPAMSFPRLGNPETETTPFVSLRLRVDSPHPEILPILSILSIDANAYPGLRANR